MTHVQTTMTPLDFEIVDPEKSGDEDVVPEPMFSRFKVSVELGSAKKQLYSKKRVRLLLVEVETGEVIAGAHGHIQQIGFPIYKKDGFEWSERAHKVKFTEELLLDEHGDDEAAARRILVTGSATGRGRRAGAKRTTNKKKS